MRNRSIQVLAILGGLSLALAFLPGCGKKGGGEGEGTAVLPDTLEAFGQKMEWLIPRSFEALEFACQNKADQKIDAAVSLNAYIPPGKFFSLFEGVDVTFRSLYYGLGEFNAVSPVDPEISIDSLMALLQLEARSRMAEQVRLVEEQVGNITDEVQKKNAEEDLDKMRSILAQIEASGVMLHGAEVIAYPEDLKGLMFHPDGLIRVIFPGMPAEGSWVRMSPPRFEQLMKAGGGDQG